MTDTTTPAEGETVAAGPAAGGPTGMPLPSIRCAWLPVRPVRTSRLAWLRDAVVRADDDVTNLADEAEKWFREYTEESNRADQAEERLDAAGDRIADLEQQVEKLSRCLAEADAEAERMNRILSAVRENRDGERAAREILQQAGRELTAAFNSENREAEAILDTIGRVLSRNAHRFALGAGDLASIPRPTEARVVTSAEDPGRAELLRAAYRYPHASTDPAIIVDHLPHCAACTEALPALGLEALVEACRAVQQGVDESGPEEPVAEERAYAFTILNLALSQFAEAIARNGGALPDENHEALSIYVKGASRYGISEAELEELWARHDLPAALFQQAKGLAPRSLSASSA